MSRHALLAVAAVGLAAIGAVAVVWRGDGEGTAAARRSTAVAGSVLRPAEGASGEGELTWRVGADDLTVARGGDTILRAGTARFDDVTVKMADLDGDGEDELVAGFRSGGSAGILEVDVVSAEGDVVLHHEADHGVARAGRSVLEVFAARFGPDDPNCCPSTYERRVVVVVEGGRWSVGPPREVTPEDVPLSDF